MTDTTGTVDSKQVLLGIIEKSEARIKRLRQLINLISEKRESFFDALNAEQSVLNSVRRALVPFNTYPLDQQNILFECYRNILKGNWYSLDVLAVRFPSITDDVPDGLVEEID